MNLLSALRPASFNLPLFLHVLGATLLFGGVLTMTITGFAARRRPDANGRLLARVFARTFLLVVIPAFVVMRVGAALIEKKEYPGSHNEPGWLGVGFIVSDAGVLVLLLIGIFTWLARRRQGTGWPSRALPIISAIYLLALGIAWFAMSAKPGS